MTALTTSRSVCSAAAASLAAVPGRTRARVTSGHAAPGASRSPLHLTRRGRFFLIGLPFVTGAAALLVVAAVFLLPSTVKASTEPADAPMTHSVTVQANQTLWEIAAVVDPQRDTRAVISDIAELNGLTSPTLYTGQVLEVPSR